VNQRFFDKAMQHQPVIRGIDFGNACMMALEAKPVRRNNPVQLMQRRKAHR